MPRFYPGTTIPAAIAPAARTPNVLLAGAPFGSIGNFVTVANQASLSLIRPEQDGIISGVGFSVSTLDAGDAPVDVGVYDNYGNRLVSTGATTGVVTATGLKKVALPTPLRVNAGQAYYLGYATSGATHQIQGGIVNSSALLTLLDPSAGVVALGTSYALIKATSYPLPDPIASISLALNNYAFLFAVFQPV